MGRPKQLLAFQGRTLAARVTRAAIGSDCAAVFAVLGAAAGEVAAALEGLEVEHVVNPDWSDGLASSIRAGVLAVRSSRFGVAFDGLMLLLADQPRVTSAGLDALIDRFRAVGGGPEAIVASSYAGTVGPPAIFGRAHWDALGALEGDMGAKSLLTGRGCEISTVPFALAAVDVDTPADYHALLDETDA